MEYPRKSSSSKILSKKKKIFFAQKHTSGKLSNDSGNFVQIHISWPLIFCLNFESKKHSFRATVLIKILSKKKNKASEEHSEVKIFWLAFFGDTFFDLWKNIFFEKWLNIAKITYISGKRLHIVKKRCKNWYMHFFFFFAFFL